MAAAHDIEALLERLRLPRPEAPAPPAPPTLALSWPGLGDVLPDGGLPRGVVELAAPRALGGSTSVALAAVRAGQARAARAWCAWVDPEATLHAPGVVAAGVDLTRMLIVRPPRALVGHVAAKLVRSGAFEVVVVDFDAIPNALAGQGPAGPSRKRASPPEVLVRRLALAAEPGGATVLLLTDATRPRAVPWPVALRLELSRPSRAELAVRVAKDRRGRVGVKRTIPFRPAIRIAG